MVRVLACHASGRGFESRSSRFSRFFSCLYKDLCPARGLYPIKGFRNVYMECGEPMLFGPHEDICSALRKEHLLFFKKTTSSNRMAVLTDRKVLRVLPDAEACMIKNPEWCKPCLDLKRPVQKSARKTLHYAPGFYKPYKGSFV